MTPPGRENGRASLEAEHRELRVLFAAVRAALRDRDGERAAAGLERLRRLLAGHFDNEEKLYYPPLRLLRPEQAGALQGFARDHERLVEQLVRARHALEQASLAEAKLALEQVAEEFAQHEERENTLLEALEQELAGAN